MYRFKKYVKLFIYFLLYFTGALYLIVGIVKRTKKEYPALILFYHRFADDSNKSLPPKLDIKKFEKQLIHLKKWYHIITLDELVVRLNNQSSFSEPYIVITIDDGFKDNYDFAFPILKQLGIPATIYLTSGFIGTNRAPWIDEIAYALHDYPNSHFQFERLFPEKIINISSNHEKYSIWDAIYKKMLHLEHNTKNEIFVQLLHELKAKDTPGSRVMLDWFEINEMKNNQIVFGAHTLTHPTLSRMAAEEAMLEIRESKSVIEEKLETKVKHFAIPNGKDEDFTEELREFCKREGFDSITTTNFGIVKKGTNPYALPRVSFSDHLFIFAVDMARYILFSR